ncbi:MAG: polyphosphate kinase 2 [Desulfobacterales bacterium]|uniref:ADP/GDP-polyphosphate phosphotransferase n=1 Tax=Candidatus Desulfatibia profunda TaxID=2841695 RepID=A0A8J6NR77_9BACT|nr:polyphosphate kinase 2 [Candidatus Desulfatibia profunda]MBL7179459.1 polyphosphate kinase 2 [Desulfobacterales bacterium]
MAKAKKKKNNENPEAPDVANFDQVAPVEPKAPKAKKQAKAQGTKKEKKLKKELSEHTSFKNINNKKSKKRQAVWVKKFTLTYEEELQKLQIELLKWQKHVIANDQRVLLLFEGRDAAGKGGTIKRIVEHLNPRGARVVALLKPSDRERTQWYFQRYIQQLPSGGEIVLFDRSWYNRAMVEPTMGFCTDEENKRFLKDVPLLESMLVKGGISLFKFFFSVSKEEQVRRFQARITDPLKQYKISPVDREAQERWDDYTIRKFQMLNETNRTISPWSIIRSDNKKKARLNCIKYILSKVEYNGKIAPEKLQVDSEIVVSGIDEIRFMEDHLMSGMELPG